jgi:DNA-binding NtrC family response regulator
MSATRTVVPTVQARSVVVVTPDTDLRQRLSRRLESMRWQVLAAGGGAEAMVHLQDTVPEAMIVDHWLPDLNVAEFTEHAAAMCPGTDLLQMDGTSNPAGQRCVRRNELLHALREVEDEAPPGTAAVVTSMVDVPAWRSAPVVVPSREAVAALPFVTPEVPTEVRMHLPEIVGDSPAMREMARMVKLVAGHTANVLIQGDTGSGKELVAKAVHRLSPRAGKPFAVLNCAAIPEHLLEAELFGHARGAFTGAVSSRVGRIEAAHGGTLFLDEIGEMPLPLQAKMLRFLENGEIQRVGDNDVSRVDVRIVAATHQPLEKHAGERLFRLDLYYRLAVFPVNVPALRDHREDLPMLVEYLLRKFGEDAPRCTIDAAAMDGLMRYEWPGNVRQLRHALQRACILAGVTHRIGREHFHLPAA